MKYLSLLLFILLLAEINISAQSTNPTTTKEIQDKLKQTQQQLDKLTPEQKKMMEQMGISTSVPSLPAGVSGTDFTAALGGDAYSVPAKNATLIAAIPNIVLTPPTVLAYLKELNVYIEKSIAADAKFVAENAWTYFKNNKLTPAMMGNEAIGFWSMGKPEIAVYMIGKASAEDAADAGMLSNLGAMLSMSGAPHKAIPLLEYLSKLYPGNTTILNNLGQAWFYLGETGKASVALDKVVKAFAYHPQANYTQCLIEQGKGNKAQAIEKMKNSLAYSYSADKINMLRKLGYKVKGSDMRKPFRPDPDPLGLHNFARPDVPTSYTEELRLKPDWDAFELQLNQETMELNSQLQAYISEANSKAAATYKKLGDKKGNVTLNSVASEPASKAAAGNIYEQVAQKNLEEMGKDGGAAYRLKKAKARIDSARKSFGEKDLIQRKNLEKQHSTIASQETELAKKGENIGYDNCVVQEKYSEWVYKTYNKPLEEAYQEYLHQLYVKITEELYWKQFTQDEATFEATKIAAKKTWLAALGDTRYIATKKYGDCTPTPPKASKYKLAEFDDMHCRFISTLNFGAYSQTFECGKAHVTFDAGKFSGTFDFKFDDSGKNKFVKSTLEATAIDQSISANKGPLQIGASVKAGMGVEITSRGIEDVYATAEAKITAGSNTVSDPAGVVNDPSVSITASGRMSLISGNMTGAISGFGK